MIGIRAAGKSILLAAILALAGAPASGGDGRPNPYEGAVTAARRALWGEISGGRCASATAAIMVDGKVVYSEGFGMADRERGIPVDKNTLFNMGSVSKIYAAAAIMLLVDDGKVSLDDPVTGHLPEFKMADDRYKTITVRMLLNHTSGLPGTQGANAVGFAYNDKFQQETLDTLARAHLKHEPGAMAIYCNDGFTLAEMIVEHVSGREYADFLDRRIFGPLGLKNTDVSIGELKGRPVALYYDPQTAKVHPPEALSVLGAGGLSATAEDLCRFADAFSARNKLLKKPSLDEMRKTQPPASRGKLRNPEISFGLGWDMTGLPRYEAAGIQVLGKSGGTGEYSSMVYAAPDQRISVAVIASGPKSGAMKIALDMLDAVLVDKKLIRKEERTVAAPVPAQRWPQDQASFGGYYANEEQLFQAVFDADKNSVTVFGFQGQEKTPANTLVYNDGYYHDPKGGRSYFAAIGGEDYAVSHLASFGVDKIALQKLKPVKKPQRLRIDMDGKRWLRRNVDPLEAISASGSHFVKSSLYRDLPGYVSFMGVKRIETPESAGMPFDAVRDQTELSLFDKDGATWAWVSSMLYSPADGAGALRAGENPLRIGGEGYNEWLRADEGMILSFTKTRGGRVIVLPPEDDATYDSAVDTGDAYVAKGGFVEFAGSAGDALTILAKPAALQSALDDLVAERWASYASSRTAWGGGVALYLATPKGSYFSARNLGSRATPKIHFRGASTTKTFTSAAIMLLHQQGKLDIDDKITASMPGSSEPYVPDTADYAIPYKDKITIRMLLSHRAGVWDVDNSTFPATAPAPLPGKNYIAMVMDEDPVHDFTFDELLGAVAAHKLSFFVPGTSYHYSDTGYSMLGKIIERVSGQRYDQFLKDNLLTPNGLSETSFPYRGGDTKLPAPFETGYSRLNKAVAETTEDNMSSHVGEGNVITTPADLSGWMRRLVRGEAGLQPATVRMMTDVLPTPTGNYGLGISSTAGLGYGHGGAHPGYATVVNHDPAQDVTVVLSASIMDYDDPEGEFHFLSDLVRSAKNLLGYSIAAQEPSR